MRDSRGLAWLALWNGFVYPGSLYAVKAIFGEARWAFSRSGTSWKIPSETAATLPARLKARYRSMLCDWEPGFHGTNFGASGWEWVTGIIGCRYQFQFHRFPYGAMRYAYCALRRLS